MTTSPFGRYAEGEGEGPLHHVRLLNLPVRLLADARDRHDSLLREFALLALAVHPSPQASRLHELTQVLGVRYGAARPRPDDVVDDALAQGQASIDVTYDVPATVRESAARLEQLMSAADDFCRSEQLLTLPRNALQLRFERWYFAEFHRQVGGEPARPWDGPLDP